MAKNKRFSELDEFFWRSFSDFQKKDGTFRKIDVARLLGLPPKSKKVHEVARRISELVSQAKKRDAGYNQNEQKGNAWKLREDIIAILNQEVDSQERRKLLQRLRNFSDDLVLVRISKEAKSKLENIQKNLNKKVNLYQIMSDLITYYGPEYIEKQISCNNEHRPFVPIEKSVYGSYIICLECGWQGVFLKKHIEKKHQQSPEEYLNKWNLDSNYPFFPPERSKEKKQLVKMTKVFDQRYKIKNKK